MAVVLGVDILCRFGFIGYKFSKLMGKNKDSGCNRTAKLMRGTGVGHVKSRLTVLTEMAGLHIWMWHSGLSVLFNFIR